MRNRRNDMAYYSICPKCGCNLDPQEKCDCETEETEKQDFFRKHLRMAAGSGQLVFAFGCRESADEEKSHY